MASNGGSMVISLVAARWRSILCSATKVLSMPPFRPICAGSSCGLLILDGHMPSRTSTGILQHNAPAPVIGLSCIRGGFLTTLYAAASSAGAGDVSSRSPPHLLDPDARTLHLLSSARAGHCRHLQRENRLSNAKRWIVTDPARSTSIIISNRRSARAAGNAASHRPRSLMRPAAPGHGLQSGIK